MAALKKKRKEADEPAAAWHDADDDIEVSEAMVGVRKLPKKVTADDKYKNYLEAKFSSVYSTPSWATKKETVEESDDSDEEFLRTAGDLTTKSEKLEKDLLNLKKCAKLTRSIRLKSTAKCVQFHPTSELALVATTRGSVHLLKVDGKTNPSVQVINFQNFHIENARFLNRGQQLLVGSQSTAGHFFYYDLASDKIVKASFMRGREKFALGNFVLSHDQQLIAAPGKNGFVHILTTKTKENIFDLKMNGNVLSMTFNEESNKLLTHGDGGKVYVWDVRNSRTCLNRFTDEGCVQGTAIATSLNDQFCVTGSDVGVVNFYHFEDVISQSEPRPFKVLMNLTTEISTIKFNYSSELLTMSSRFKNNSIRAVHMPSLTVYQNFPEPTKNYKLIYDVDFSPNSGYLALANTSGHVYLYRLAHYQNY